MKQTFLSIVIIIGAASLAVVGAYAGFVDTEESHDNVVEAGTVDLWLKNPTGVGESFGQSVLRTWHYEDSTSGGGPMDVGDSIDSFVKLNSFGTVEGDSIDILCVTVNSELGLDSDDENDAENAILITTGVGWDDDGDGAVDEDDVDDIDNDGDGLVDEDPSTGAVPIPVDANHGVYDKDRVMLITYMKYHMTTIINMGMGGYINPAFFTSSDDLNGDGYISLYEFSVKGLHGLTPVPDNEGEIEFQMSLWFAPDTVRHGSSVPVGNEYQGDETNMTLIFTIR